MAAGELDLNRAIKKMSVIVNMVEPCKYVR